MKSLRIVVHDFIGHPFQVQLSRKLAANGHCVLHLHFPGFVTPKGPLERRPDDPSTFIIEGTTVPFRHRKYNFLARSAQEWVYSRKCIRRVLAFAPEVMLSANATPNVQYALLRACRRCGIGFVPWVQDFHGVAIGRMLRKKIGRLTSTVAGKYFEQLDCRVLQRSDQIVFISPAFLEIARRWAGVAEKSHVIENWASLADLPVLSKDNSWSRAHGLTDKKVLLYAGTLGLKHNPGLLEALAAHFAPNKSIRIVVISQGPGAERLRRWQKQSNCSNLLLMDYQPYESLPEVLAAADVLVTILDEEAGDICVPSKILSYCCARRPILAAMPSHNVAAIRLRQANAGIVVSPKDTRGFMEAAGRLLGDASFASIYAANARAYAEGTFDIEAITHRFESVLRLAAPPRAIGESTISAR